MNHCDKVLYNVEAHDVGKTPPWVESLRNFYLSQVWRWRFAPRLNCAPPHLPRNLKCYQLLLEHFAWLARAEASRGNLKKGSDDSSNPRMFRR